MQGLFLECALRAALIAAGTAAVLGILRVKTAGARHRAWASVVLSMLVLPIWTAWGPKAVVPVLPTLTAQGATLGIAPANVAPGYAPAQGNLKTLQPASARPAWNWRTYLAGLYLLGVAALLARLLVGTVRAHLLIRGATLRDGRLTSSSCSAPVTVGWLDPTVILPECWREWPQEQLEAVLTHEREHARRRDPLVQWLALLNRAIFWFHPLAWWLERRLSGLAEESCDAAVLAQGHDPHEYSEYLLEIARSVARSGARVNIWGMAMPGSFLTKRIRHILEGRPAPRLTRVRTASAAGACAILSVVFAAGAVDHRRPAPAVTNVAMSTIAATADPQIATPPAQVHHGLGLAARLRASRSGLMAYAAPLLAQAQTSPPAAGPPATTQELKYKDRRLLVIYFDMAAMTDDDLTRAVSAAQKFVRAQMQPQDLLAIIQYRNSTVRVLEDFSNDRDKLVQKLQELTAVQSANSGEVSSATPRSTVLLTAMKLLEPLAAKKALIYFTVGASRPPDIQPELKEATEAAVRANIALYFVDVRGVQ